jgi:hypothetical protein
MEEHIPHDSYSFEDLWEQADDIPKACARRSWRCCSLRRFEVCKLAMTRTLTSMAAAQISERGYGYFVRTLCIRRLQRHPKA